jgi:hypothetical protein
MHSRHLFAHHADDVLSRSPCATAKMSSPIRAPRVLWKAAHFSIRAVFDLVRSRAGEIIRSRGARRQIAGSGPAMTGPRVRSGNDQCNGMSNTAYA